MIFCWIKIMYYKIIKLVRPSGKTGTGTEPHTGARATDPNHWSSHTDAPGTTCPDRGTVSGEIVSPWIKDMAAGERIQELIDKGLVSVPVPGMDDVMRMAALEEDRRAREEAAGVDPSRCPCAGRCYPMAGMCRWCRCHDPLNVHHLSPEQIAEIEDRMVQPPARYMLEEIMAVRPSKEIVCCSRCGHPQHTPGNGRCAFQVASRMQDEGFHTCRCEGEQT